MDKIQVYKPGDMMVEGMGCVGNFEITLCSNLNFHTPKGEYQLSPETIQDDITPYESAIMSFVLCFLTTAQMGLDWSVIPDSFFRHTKLINAKKESD